MIKAFFLRFADVLRDGVAIFRLAPIIPAIIMLPEFIQHVVEIQLGMFESEEAFKALQEDSSRMFWGYIKLASLLLSILAAVRFWGAKERGQRWWDVRQLAWINLILAIVLIVITSLPEFLLTPVVGADMAGYISLAILFATLPLLALLAAGLIGDKSVNLLSIFRSGWGASLRIIAYAAAVWAPLQWIHGKNHSWALGQSDAIVWALMVFDTIVVGLLAMMVGTAIHHGYSMGQREEAKAP